MAQPQHRPGLTPQPDGAWQYAVHRVEINNMEGYARDMNEMGAQGWELVAASPLSLSRALGGPNLFHGEGNTNAMMLIWKRRVG